MSDVSREAEARLVEYEALLRRWNARINLVASSSLADLRHRHIYDCVQITTHVSPEDGVWADLGSGGGLPGIVLAICFADRPTSFRLIESDQRKATFLRTVIRELDLKNATVLTQRIEAAEPLNAAYVSARALAPLPRLMSYVSRHMAPEGQAWLMKGAQWQQELADARRDWSFQAQHYPSTTQSGAAILRISGLSHD